MGWNSKCSFSVVLATSQTHKPLVVLSCPVGQRECKRSGWEEALLGPAFMNCAGWERAMVPGRVGRGNRSVLFGLDCYAGVYISSSRMASAVLASQVKCTHFLFGPGAGWDPCVCRMCFKAHRLFLVESMFEACIWQNCFTSIDLAWHSLPVWFQQWPAGAHWKKIVNGIPRRDLYPDIQIGASLSALFYQALCNNLKRIVKIPWMWVFFFEMLLLGVAQR